MNIFKRQPLSVMSPQSFTSIPQLPLFTQLSNEMNRFFDQDLPSVTGGWNLMEGQWMPNIDIEQKDKEYVVRADIPGVEAKDINVYMDNDILTIEGKREAKSEIKGENYRCLECSYGNFARSLRLPDAVSADKIKAHSHNGVLEVKVAKKASSKQKNIKVTAD